MSAPRFWSVRLIGGLMLLTALWHLWLGLFGLAAYAITTPFAPTTNDTILPTMGGLLLTLFVANWLTGWGLWAGRESARKAAIALHLWGLVTAFVFAALNNAVPWRLLQMSVALWALWVLTRPAVREAFQANDHQPIGQTLLCGFAALMVALGCGLAVGGMAGRWQSRPETKSCRWLQIRWHTDFAAAQAEAIRTGKPILLALIAGGKPQEPC